MAHTGVEGMGEKTTETIFPVLIEDEMKRSYIDYAMSVIIGRALPDVRDGLKPVHRRILYSMWEAGIIHEKPHKKSARVVGDVLGKYHPHGDTAVYDALVRMAQNFSLRYPLIDGQGNFGSIDGDSAAAMRYTEARLAEIAGEMLRDIEKETVDFTLNYDQSLKEPEVLPAKLPNLLINGSTGIAVGMATNIPPHNLSEVCDAIVALIDTPSLELKELMRYIKGPDFPTGGILYGTAGLITAYQTGRGQVCVRALAHIEKKKKRERIIITQIPYQVNKAKLVESIADMGREKRFEGISEVRDESDKDGIRIVIEVKRDSDATVLLNNLYKHTQCQITFGIIMLALVDGEPRTLPLRDMLYHFIEHRKDVIRKRSLHELKEAERRVHILDGLLIAIANIDEVVAIIKGSESSVQAKERLKERFGLSELQTQEILNMQLRRLTALETSKLETERAEFMERIDYLKHLLESESMLLDVVREETLQIKKKYGDDRRTEIMREALELDVEDMIEEEEMLVTITSAGYIKCTSLEAYRKQHRGGRGSSGVRPREGDFVSTSIVSSNLNTLLFITSKGKAYAIKVYELPEGDRQARGKPVVNFLRLSKDEKVSSVIALESFEEDKYVLMATHRGFVKKTSLSQFSRAGKSGVIAIRLDEGDELMDARLTDGNSRVLLATALGQGIVFNETDVRPMGRNTRGVRGIRLRLGDSVVGLAVLENEGEVLFVT
ncbi:MAG: DNA gyrase subunit A, partial [Methermicoccaceae archaeon]